MHWCALCQEHREMQARLSDNVVMPMTVINPPLPQEMTTENTSSAAADNHNHQSHVQMQAP